MIALYIALYLAIGLLIFAWRFRVAASELDLYTLNNCKKSASALLNQVEIFGIPGPIVPLFMLGWPLVLVVRAFVLALERCPNLLWLLIERDVTTRSIAAKLTQDPLKIAAQQTAAQFPSPQIIAQYQAAMQQQMAQAAKMQQGGIIQIPPGYYVQGPQP